MNIINGEDYTLPYASNQVCCLVPDAINILVGLFPSSFEYEAFYPREMLAIYRYHCM